MSVRLWAVMVCGVMASCGGRESEKDKQIAAVERLYEALAIEYCNYVFRCCEASEIGYFKTAFLDRPGCDAYYHAVLKNESYLYRLAVGQGGVQVDESAINACVDALRALACEGITGTAYPTFPVQQPEACATSKIFIGVRQVGEACESALDCAKGSRCYTSSSVLSNKGVCTPYRAKGEPCTSSKDCDSTSSPLVCVTPKDSPASCQPPAKEGEPCSDRPCDTTDSILFCDTGTNPKAPVCARRTLKKEGENCTSSKECETDLFCNYTSYPMVCGRLKQTGEPCKSSSECKSARCDYVTALCGGALCDGTGNGPPVQLDSPVKPDWYYPKPDWYPAKDYWGKSDTWVPKPDLWPPKDYWGKSDTWVPPKDQFVWPDMFVWPDLWPAKDTSYWPTDL